MRILTKSQNLDQRPSGAFRESTLNNQHGHSNQRWRDNLNSRAYAGRFIYKKAREASPSSKIQSHSFCLTRISSVQYTRFEEILKMADRIRFFELNTGAKIPSVGFGTWQADPGLVGEAIATAIKVFFFSFFISRRLRFDDDAEIFLCC